MALVVVLLAGLGAATSHVDLRTAAAMGDVTTVEALLPPPWGPNTTQTCILRDFSHFAHLYFAKSTAILRVLYVLRLFVHSPKLLSSVSLFLLLDFRTKS